MMKNVNKILSVLVILLGSAILISMTHTYQDPAEPWEVSAKFKNMENPVKADDASVKTGRMLYTKNCASCHGMKARGLDTFSGDMSSDAYQGQTDGEHFYKSKFGRGEMPKYENKIPDEDIWHMVNYMRTFGK